MRPKGRYIYCMPAVLPESKGYVGGCGRDNINSGTGTCDGDNGSGTTDYKALYDAEIKKNKKLQAKYDALLKDMRSIQAIAKRY